MKLTPFAVEISLPGQGRMAVGGLCDSAARRTVQALCRALTPPCLPSQDPLGIDRALAALMDTFPSEGIYAAGASSLACREAPTRTPAVRWKNWRTGCISTPIPAVRALPCPRPGPMPSAWRNWPADSQEENFCRPSALWLRKAIF